MGTNSHTSVLSFQNFGVLFLLLLQLNILRFSQAATTAEIDLLRKQRPLQRVSDVYADAAKFQVDIPNPIGGRFLKCSERGTHVVQLALQSDPNNFSFSHNVNQKPEGFIVGGLKSNTDYVVRVACKYNGATQPGEWSDPSNIHTAHWTEKGTIEGGGEGSGSHHHHYHDNPDDGKSSGGSGSGSGASPSTTSSLLIINHIVLFLFTNVILAASTSRFY